MKVDGVFAVVSHRPEKIGRSAHSYCKCERGKVCNYPL